MANIVQRINVTLGERGDRLTRAEDKTVKMMHKAQQFADTAHKVIFASFPQDKIKNKNITTELVFRMSTCNFCNKYIALFISFSWH